MARINIEDSLYTDPRYFNLLIKTGDQYKALGLVFTAFKLAQRHWIKHRSIPKENWISDLDPLVDCGLAVILDNNDFYIKGSEDQFGWLIQKSNAGKSPKNKQSVGTGVNGRLTGANGAKPLTPPPPLSPNSLLKELAVGKQESVDLPITENPTTIKTNYFLVFCNKVLTATMDTGFHMISKKVLAAWETEEAFYDFIEPVIASAHKKTQNRLEQDRYIKSVIKKELKDRGVN